MRYASTDESSFEPGSKPVNQLFSVRNLGILPLILASPFLYYPKVLSGDTQLWVFIAALITFVTFRIRLAYKIIDLFIYFIALFSLIVLVLRIDSSFEAFRYVYTFLTFCILWEICLRDKGDYLDYAIKFTICVWFAVGLYQYVFVTLGLPIEVSGRFVEGRGGVPSLTAEPSFYGSLSVVQAMYLLKDNQKSNLIFIFMAIISVIFSGSILAFVLLLMPLAIIVRKYKIAAGFYLVAVAMLVIYLSLDGAISRASAIVYTVLGVGDSYASGAVSYQSSPDASLNLRLGHIYFTLYENLLDSLIFVHIIDFMDQYNSFADNSAYFIATNSNYVLPTLGRLVYGSGALGLLLFLLILYRATKFKVSGFNSLVHFIFIIACFLNPISIANIFLVSYLLKKEKQ